MAKPTVLSALLLTSSLSAQLTVTTTATEFTVSNPQVASAPGVLAEDTELQVGQAGLLTNIARLAYEVDNTGWPLEKVLWISGSSLASDWFDLQTGPTLSELLDATIVLTSVEPMLVDVHVELTHLQQGPTPTSSALLDVGGMGSVTLGDGPSTYRVEVDANGFAMDYDMSNSMPWPDRHISGVHSHVILKVTLTPVVAESFGAACNGANLSFTSSFTDGALVHATHPTAPVGLLVIGTSTIDTPLSQIIGIASNCPLRTAPLHTVPFVFQQDVGERAFNFTPPPGDWRLQVLTSDDSGVSTSNGLRLLH